MKIIVFVVASVLFAGTSSAQLNYGASRTPTTTVGISYSMIDFAFVRDDAEDASFSFEDPAYGVFYSRPGFSVSVMRGVSSVGDDEDLKLLDGAIAGWVSIRPFKDLQDKSLDVFFPVGISSDYRKMTKKGGPTDADVFEVTVLAIGVGLGIATGIAGSDLLFRAMPSYGIASRSFGNDTGSSAVLTADVEWASGLINDRFGVFFSYGYRWQKWTLSALSLPGGADAGDFKYEGSHHSFQVGITF